MSLPVPPSTGVFSSHHANCHCGALRLYFKISPPLDSYPVVICNCSICQRNGYLFVYPEKDNVTIEDISEELLGSYSFGSEIITHKFCKACGSSVFFEFNNEKLEGDPNMPKIPNVLGVNVRMITGVEPGDLILNKVEYMRDFGPKYTAHLGA